MSESSCSDRGFWSIFAFISFLPAKCSNEAMEFFDNHLDRVFSHALSTVNKIRTGAEKPPAATRLKLYGLYKQSMGMKRHTVLIWKGMRS